MICGYIKNNKVGFFGIIFLLTISRFLFLKSQKFSGDGFLTVVPTPIPLLNTCHILFDEIKIEKGINHRRYSFKNIPCRHIEVRLYSFSFCPVEMDDYLSNNANIDVRNEISELLEDVSIHVGIEIYDDQSEYLSVERGLFNTSLNLMGGKWFIVSDGGPVTWRYDDVNLSSFKSSKGKNYEFKISIELEEEPKQDICIQPFMISGTSLNL